MAETAQQPSAAPAPSSGESAVAALVRSRASWAALPATERLGLVEAVIPRLARVAPRWAEAAAAMEGLRPDDPTSGEEWLTGPALGLLYLRQLARSLRETIDAGAPRLPGRARRLPDGGHAVPVFPRDAWDRLFFPGVRAEAWLAADAPAAPVPPAGGGGAVCLVLGGGNVSAIPVIDALGKLFVEGRVVLLKLHRVTPFLEPLLADAFEPLIRRGYLRILPGGGGAGRQLAALPGIDEIHVTGSDRTYESIVFGDGPEGAARRARDEPLFVKPVSAELGNVSPVIVVPGRWPARDVARQAEHVASMLTQNAGFNCVAARVVITPAGWPQRAAFLDGIRRTLAATPTRFAWYPGADARYARALAEHPAAERFGRPSEGHLPWAFIAGLDPGFDSGSFREEAFCGVFAETAIEGADVAGYLDGAVRFANERLWGTLAANLVVRPGAPASRADADAVQRAIAELRYGTVAVNTWSAFGFGNGVSPWGAHPGSPRSDIQSGVGFTHNALGLRGIRKSILWGDFRPWPKPVWFASHRTLHRVGPALARFQAAPGVRSAAALAWWGSRG